MADAEDFFAAIAGERESLLEFCEKHEIQNLRTIRFMLSVLNSVVKVSGKLPQVVFHRIAYAVAAMSTEYKAGRLVTKRPISSDDLLMMTFSGIGTTRTNEEAQTENNSSEAEFYNRYVRFNWNDYLYIDSIFHYILEGYLDSEKLQRQLGPHLGLNRSRQDSTIEKLAAFRELDDEEFREVVRDTFSLVEAGDLTIRQFLQAAMFLVKFWGVRLLENNPADALRICKSKILAKTLEDMPGPLRDEFASFYDADSPPILREILEDVLAAYEEIRRKRIEDLVRDFNRKLFAGNAARSEDYNRIRDQAIMSVLPLAEMKQMLEDASNRGLTKFREFLMDRYLRVANIRLHYSSERPTFLALEKHLRERPVSGLRKYVFEETADALGKVAAHLGEEPGTELNGAL